MQISGDISIVIASNDDPQWESWRRDLAGMLPDARVRRAMDPSQAENMVREHAPRSVLVDTNLAPDMDALANLTAALREAAPDIHVVWVLATAPTDAAIWLQRARQHHVDILVSPVHPLELTQRCLGAVARQVEPGREQRILANLAAERSRRLYESDERYRFLFNSSSDGILVASLPPEQGKERITMANNRLCQLLGYPRPELLALSPKDLFEPHRLAHVEARMESLRIYRHIQFNSVLISRDGTQLPAAISARLFALGTTPAIIFAVHPLRTHEAPGGRGESPSVAETGQIIYELDVRSGAIELHGAARAITGYPREKIEAARGKSLLAFVHEDDRRTLASRLAKSLNDLGAYNNRYRIRNARGEVRHLEDNGIVLPDVHGRAARLLGNVRDITEHVLAARSEKRAEQALQHSKRMESLGVLAGGIAHDFNNILAAIIGLTDMSIQALEDGPTEVLEDLGEALGAAHRAKDLVKQILAFSRQSGQEHRPLHLHVVVREALSLLRASTSPSVTIIDSVDPRSGVVLANATQMHQVVMNYCTNGLQAMSEKGGVLEVKLEDVEVSSRFADNHPKLHPGPYLKLTVADRGHGMAPSVVRRVFDPFYTTKGPGEGAGMGLAMVYGIVADHGGAILVDSVLGQGTEFTTYLPRVESILRSEQPAESSIPRGTGRILVIDDEQPVRRFCERALGQLGYTVHTEGDPVDALELLKADPDAFDVVITDYNLPGMSGVSLARRIRKLRPALPVILFTGFSQDIEQEQARKAGILEVLSKPVLVSQMAARLKHVLENRHAEQPAGDDNDNVRKGNA